MLVIVMNVRGSKDCLENCFVSGSAIEAVMIANIATVGSLLSLDTAVGHKQTGIQSLYGYDVMTNVFRA